ncbi:helix-turn-helix transcriptional regulator [Gorillibacterium sp. sgz5001074]|uniref:helix-turn-helix transcriptional regulator n=1 Tax=Gorillibacterium sp. sgz5001074 TaxID=3446695 RepID=UPI003F66D96D
MSTDAARLSALSEFLKIHRAKLQPNAVGLPPGLRRRTPGLRREEVALIAGVSTTWYTWLEQGRDIQMSLQVLERIAYALQLNEEEKKYMLQLAASPRAETQPDAAEEPTGMTEALESIVAGMNFPVIVSDRRCHIVGWNRAASAVFLDFGQVPPESRNMIRLLFSRKELKALAVNWEDFARGYISMFRSYYGKYVGDDWYGGFIGALCGESQEFERLWREYDVNSAPEVSLEFRHAKAGRMLFELTSLQVQGGSDLRFSIYTPAPGTDTGRKMDYLLRRFSKA